MRKILFILMMLPLAATAQTKFGYFNYKELLQRLPQYKSVKADFDELVKRCDDEIARNEQELTRCYVAFLDGQHEFPEPILRKRQKELQDLVDKSIIFRDNVKEWLTQAHDSLFAPLHATIDDAVARVCTHNDLAYIVDCEKSGYSFMNPKYGYDVTNAVIGTIFKGEPQTVFIVTSGVKLEKKEEEKVEGSDEEGAQEETTNEEESAKTYNEEVTEGARH